MDIINPNAAGIDIGSRSHFVAINQEHSDVREFGVYDQDMKALVKWLLDNDIKTDGFEGSLMIQLISISSDELLIDNGIRIQMELEMDFIITKKALDKKNIVKFKGKEFSEITGDFTLNDKEIQINNISKRIIESLSNKISEEIN